MRQGLPEPVETLQPGAPITVTFKARRSGELAEVYLPAVVDWQSGSASKTVVISLTGVNVDPKARSAVILGWEPACAGRTITLHLILLSGLSKVRIIAST
jgi:hypothetical protein